MIKLKELVQREYEGKICQSFKYIVCQGDKKIEAEYRRGKEGREWGMRIVLDRTRDTDHQVYSFSYELPKNGMPLPLIAAIGLKYFQLRLKEEVQFKSSLDFELGQITEDMNG